MLQRGLILMLLFLAPVLAAQEEIATESKHSSKTAPTLDDLPIGPLVGPNALVTERGSRVQGKFEGIEAGRFVFNDPEIGKVKVKSSSVRAMLLSDTQRIWFQEDKDSEVQEGRMAPLFYREELGDMRLRVHSFDPEGRDEFRYLDPGALHRVSLSSYALRPSEWKFTGNISGSLEWNDGNKTRTDYGVNAWFKYQNPKHIFETRESFTYAETDGRRSAQRGNFEFSYRYLFASHNALFFREVFSHDDFAKLAVRSISSAGLTFYFLKEDDITLSLDAGASYSEEHRKRGALNKYSDGGQFSLRLDAKPSEDIRILFNSRATMPFDRPSDAIITTELTFSFFVWKELTLGILFRNNHDSQPPPNVEQDDYTVRFLLGWSFR